MKAFFLIFLIFGSSAFAQFKDWYPEDRTYGEGDRGMRPYRATSLFGSGTVTLTFDDGPHPHYTPLLLDILKSHGVKATFFVLTDKVNAVTFPLVKRMLDEGHLVASHGPNHDRSSDLTKSEWVGQFKSSFLSLAHWHRLAGHVLDRPFYRFPYGDYGARSDYHHMNALREAARELLGDNCVHMAFWDIDTADWVPGMTAKEISGNIFAFLYGGSYTGFRREGSRWVKERVEISKPLGGGVVLQHDVHLASVKATELFLAAAKFRNINVVRLDEVEEFLVTRDCRL